MKPNTVVFQFLPFDEIDERTISESGSSAVKTFANALHGRVGEITGMAFLTTMFSEVA